jgi:sugar phosphate isomerase/epimerase
LDRKQLVINTLVFLKELKKGTEQSVLLDIINELEIKNVEIRREFIQDFPKELESISEKSKLYNMKVYYSVPEWLYKENRLLVHNLEKYFKEAKDMNCHNVKLTIGQLVQFDIKDIEVINKLSEKYQVKLTVENDQTKINGKSEAINKFLVEVKNLKGRVTFTFDIGNWAFQGEDPLKNAQLLKSFVTYIHLKDIDKEKNNVLLNEGVIDWESVLEILPKALPIALEYPCDTKEVLQAEINKILK